VYRVSVSAGPASTVSEQCRQSSETNATAACRLSVANGQLINREHRQTDTESTSRPRTSTYRRLRYFLIMMSFSRPWPGSVTPANLQLTIGRIRPGLGRVS